MLNIAIIRIHMDRHCHLARSRSTQFRWLQSSGLALQRYSPLSDIELDHVIHQIKVNNPNDGEVMVDAHLKSRGIYIPQSCLRASINRLDPHVQDHLRSAVK